MAPCDVASSICQAFVRHVIQRTVNPRLLCYTACYDVASNIRQAVPGQGDTHAPAAGHVLGAPRHHDAREAQARD
jgi:hypothetical protein